METNISSDDCESIENLATSAAKLAYHNFKWHYISLVLVNSTLFCGVSAFLQSYNKTAIVGNQKLVPTFYSHTKQFVLFGQNLMDILSLLEWMQFHGFDNTGRFLIICQSNALQDCDEAEAIKVLWDHKVVNVIFINHKPNNGAIGYTYEYGKDCKYTPPIKVTNWDFCIKGQRKYCRNKFPVKFKNLYGCPIIVSTFNQEPYMSVNNGVPSGADGYLLRIIIEALNATLVIRSPLRESGWGNLDENGVWVGSLGDLYYDLANFSMTSASITQTRYEDFHMSNFYYTITLGWVTHPPAMEMSYYKLLRPFKADTQIALAVSFIIVIIIVLIYKTNICIYIYKKMNFGRIPDKVLFSSWEICMGQPIFPFPSKMSLSYLVLIWIWYCFLMRTFYQVHLINSLKNDIYLDQFSSIEEAIFAGYPIGGGTALKDYYVDDPLVYENWEYVSSTIYFKVMHNLTEGMKFVLAMSTATAKFYLRVPGRRLYILPQVIINCPSVLFFKKFSPFVDPINEILERLIEFGWTDMTFKNSTMSKIVETSENEDKPIKLSNFAGCYAILLVGWTSSFMLLIIEVYHMKKQIRNTLYRN